MIVGVPLESEDGERRVALVPSFVPVLAKSGFEVLVQKSAGQRAGFLDVAYEQAGARLAMEEKELFASADVVLKVGSNSIRPELLRAGQIVLGLLDPLGSPETVKLHAEKGVTSFALELLPRITRAQPMDALSSMATIAGYKAVLIAASALDKIHPMMITAAGTITPAKVFVVGAGVAGLQAIATARRLGASVQAYDVRPAVKEQVESLEAKFVEMELDSGDSETSGGYAKEMGEDFYRRQREMMTQVVAESDAVITTAALPGKKAPVLITKEMVEGMRPGAVVLDMAAETGGNCELTNLGETVEANGVKVIGPINLPGSVPYHASQMYSKNVSEFAQNLIEDGQLCINLEDPIISDSLLTHEGKIVNARVREMLGLEATQD